MSILQSLILIFAAILIGCGPTQIEENADIKNCVDKENQITSIAGRGALLASRIESLDELKNIVQIDYFDSNGIIDTANSISSMVQLKQCMNNQKIISVLRSGISQSDIVNARDGGIQERIQLLFHSPYAISNRKELSKIYSLARRRNDLFGYGDVAFYDLAEAANNKISTKDLAIKNIRDAGEKGYINSFNHITAQAIITSCFSEKIADFIADTHELYNMPELVTGKFTEDQLAERDDNPVDNYVDLINNEWGQEIGIQLKEKYSIHSNTVWTSDLLANYLNDLQSYYSWSFQIGMEPFKPEEKMLVRFASKMNEVLGEINE